MIRANLRALGGIPNKVQVGDMGVDGRIYPVGTKPTEAANKGKQNQTDHFEVFADDWFPIQVKQMDKVGRPDIDQFEAGMERENRQRGFFVSFAFSSDDARVHRLPQTHRPNYQASHRAGNSG